MRARKYRLILFTLCLSTSNFSLATPQSHTESGNKKEITVQSNSAATLSRNGKNTIVQAKQFMHDVFTGFINDATRVKPYYFLGNK